jgi:hypothetical protein
MSIQRWQYLESHSSASCKGYAVQADYCAMRTAGYASDCDAELGDCEHWVGVTCLLEALSK